MLLMGERAFLRGLCNAFTLSMVVVDDTSFDLFVIGEFSPFPIDSSA